ncbi:hypothetical protein MKX03_034857 [Papaver bracteatum]|nr:hypothetical protein MKX03_034857 [Papaver bracteatum]
MEKLNAWNAEIVCEIEPNFHLECDALVRNLHGRSEILAVSMHFEKDINIDHYDEHEDIIGSSHHPTVSLTTAELDEVKLSEGLRKQSISTVNNAADNIVSTVNDDAEKNSAEVEAEQM